MRLNLFLAGALGCVLAGCAALQNETNTVQMADEVSRIREAQVLRNISAAIDDHDMVPSQVLLGQGTSTIDIGTASSIWKAPFSPTREFDLVPLDVWHAQWVFTSVTDANDLRRLRNLYALVASSDQQFDALETYLDRHGEPMNTASCEQILAHTADAHERNPTMAGGPGTAPSWAVALCTMQMGDSIGCKLFQEEHKPVLSTHSYPFRRWLYWRSSGTNWLPAAPDVEPQSLGHYGEWEIAITSRACFDDFIILVQGQVPKTEEKSKDARITIAAPQ